MTARQVDDNIVWLAQPPRSVAVDKDPAEQLDKARQEMLTHAYSCRAQLARAMADVDEIIAELVAGVL